MEDFEVNSTKIRTPQSAKKEKQKIPKTVTSNPESSVVIVDEVPSDPKSFCDLIHRLTEKKKYKKIKINVELTDLE